MSSKAYEKYTNDNPIGINDAVSSLVTDISEIAERMFEAGRASVYAELVASTADSAIEPRANCAKCIKFKWCTLSFGDPLCIYEPRTAL
jgi:hypothetical protein